LFGASIESLGHRGCICEFYTTITEKSSHFATFPPALIEPCILAGCPEGGTVLDPFAGTYTTGTVAKQHGRSFIGIELNPAYLEMGRERLANTQPLIPGVLAPHVAGLAGPDKVA
jgi:DNA modification methylase